MMKGRCSIIYQPVNRAGLVQGPERLALVRDPVYYVGTGRVPDTVALSRAATFTESAYCGLSTAGLRRSHTFFTGAWEDIQPHLHVLPKRVRGHIINVWPTGFGEQGIEPALRIIRGLAMRRHQPVTLRAPWGGDYNTVPMAWFERPVPANDVLMAPVGRGRGCAVYINCLPEYAPLSVERICAGIVAALAVYEPCAAIGIWFRPRHMQSLLVQNEEILEKWSSHYDVANSMALMRSVSAQGNAAHVLLLGAGWGAKFTRLPPILQGVVG